LKRGDRSKRPPLTKIVLGGPLLAFGAQGEIMHSCVGPGNDGDPASAITNWTGGHMASLYTRSANRRRLSLAAMHKLDGASER